MPLMVDILMFYFKEMASPSANPLAVRFICHLILTRSRLFYIDNGKYINVSGNIGTI